MDKLTMIKKRSSQIYVENSKKKDFHKNINESAHVFVCEMDLLPPDEKNARLDKLEVLKTIYNIPLAATQVFLTRDATTEAVSSKSYLRMIKLLILLFLDIFTVRDKKTYH